MNSNLQTAVAVSDAKQIRSSIVVQEYIESGGKISRLETIGTGDNEVDVFLARGYTGTFTCDNGGVTWFDACFSAVVDGIRAGNLEISGRSISEI